MVRGERRDRVLEPTLEGQNEPPSPAHLHLRLLLLRLHSPADLLRPASPGGHAGLPAGRDTAAEFRDPDPGVRGRGRSLPARASRAVRADGLASGHRQGLGPRVLPLGWSAGQIDELASHADTRKFAASFPDRRHLVEWRHGRALGSPGHLALRRGWLAAPGSAALRVAQPRRRKPRHLPWKEDSMRYRLLLLLAVVVACVSLASTGRHLTFRYDIPPAHAHLRASSASYLGVFEPGVPPSYDPVSDFAQTVGKQPNLVGYYSGWVQPFPSSFAQRLYRS